MKQIALIVLGFGIYRLGLAQLEIPNAPQWQATFHVTDKGESPIAGADVYTDYLVNNGVSSKKTGITDTNGIVTLAAHSGPVIGYTAIKTGYYATHSSYDFNFRSKTGGKWHPVNPTIDVILKRISNPIPMFAKQINSQPPANGEPVGYDLEVGDWVAPYGKGVHTDIIFTREYHRKSFQDYDYKLTVSFPNRGDGIQEFVPTNDSVLKSPHEAPTSGYKPQIVRLNISHPGQKLVFDYDENRAYFFRVRTVLDENAKVKSAFYGKIYGDFMQFSYYLDPTQNDRNIEFDPRHNLLHDLKPLEGVKQP